MHGFYVDTPYEERVAEGIRYLADEAVLTGRIPFNWEDRLANAIEEETFNVTSDERCVVGLMFPPNESNPDAPFGFDHGLTMLELGMEEAERYGFVAFYPPENEWSTPRMNLSETRGPLTDAWITAIQARRLARHQ